MNFENAWVKMQSDLLQYINSGDISLGSKAVVLILFLLFTYFFIVGLWQARSIWSLKALIKKLSTPEILQDLACNAERFRTCDIDGTPDELFENILKQYKIIVGHGCKLTIVSHLKIIFMSGCREANLDPATLMRHTEFLIFKGTARLKNILGSFIILGLLGTLLGLAVSLGKLPTTAPAAAGANNVELLNGLNSLVINLEHAFFPSILGIAFTLLGFFYYGIIVNFVFNPTRGELEKSTISSWIPQIFPAYSQKLIQKLESNATRLDTHFKDIAIVAEFAGQINKETGEFKQNLEKGNQLVSQIQGQVGNVKVLGESLRENFAEKLQKFSGDFAETVTQLSSSQSEFVKLQNDVDKALIDLTGILESSNHNQVDLFEKIKDIFINSVEYSDKNAEKAEKNLNNTFEKIKESLSETMKHNSQVADRVEGNLNNLNTEISRVLSTLKQNESIFIEKFNVQTDLVNKLVSVVSDSVHSETIKNRKVAEEILSQSSEKFGQIDSTLKGNLKDILDRFDRYDTPVREAATKIENTYDGFVSVMRQAITENTEMINASQEQIKTALVEHMTKLNNGLGEDRGAMSTQAKDLRDLTQAITLLNGNMSKPIFKRLFS